MDVTETYIKMADCPEVQEQRPRTFSFFLPEMFYGRLTVDARGDTETLRTFAISDLVLVDEKSIWLPRQDQIQAMFDFPYGKPNDWRWYS